MKNPNTSVLWALTSTLLSSLVIGFHASCQVPGGFNYQTVLYDETGSVRRNTDASLKLSILQGDAAGSSVYSETHIITTDEYGIVSIQIGFGDADRFNEIDWGNGPYFLKTEVDGTPLSNLQLLSVPYALYAGSSGAVNELENRKILPENFAGTVTDVEGNVYKTVTIGTQTWMAENLRTIHLNDGTEISVKTADADWESFEEPGCSFYGNALPNSYPVVTCGFLYNFHAAYSDKLCPAGWHVPTYNQWGILIDYLGGEEEAGGKLKEPGTIHWESPNTGAENETNFTALPGGYRHASGVFNMIGILGYWWTATPDLPPDACFCGMSSNNGRVHRGTMDIHSGFSVRCIKDQSK